MNHPARIFISVAEESADVHAAALVRAVRQQGYDWTFHGLTGPRLRELGVETVFDFASRAAMLSGVLGVIGHARRAVRAVEKSWRERRPDLVVLLDSPELHLGVAELGIPGLAARARRRGIPVLYYIAPQTWAARAWRNRWIVRDIDRLACILPFEEAYFRRAAGLNCNREGAATSPECARGTVAPLLLREGLGEGRSPAPCDPPLVPPRRGDGCGRFHAEYVGHPLFETLREERPIAETVEFLKTRAGGRPIVALLPGSRRHVIDAMLPRQLEVVRRLRAAGRDVYAAISCVSEERREQIRGVLSQGAAGFSLRGTARAEARGSLMGADDPGVDIVVAGNASLLTAADLVLVASGTATLEVAYYRKPMVVMYDAGGLLRWPYRLLGRLVVRLPHLSLVNILAGARVVPEFMPFIGDVGPIATVAGQLLSDETWRRLMVRQLDEIVRPLEGSQASANVCRIMAEMLGGKEGLSKGIAKPR
jgi:lipid-A-disaccharide synthase